MRKKISSKKGAVELSMTTIIVIVIGVALLSLGLVWIRGTFKKVTGLTEGAFERGEAEIGEIFGESDDPVALIPRNTEVAQGGTGEVDVLINNFGEEDATSISLSVESKPSSNKNKVTCAFADTFELTSSGHSLKSGEGLKMPLYIEDKGSPVGFRASCTVKAETGADLGGQKSAIVTIKVVKK